MALAPRLAARILVVEDDRRTAAFLDRALSRDGYKVTVAEDGPAALALARSCSYAGSWSSRANRG